MSQAHPQTASKSEFAQMRGVSKGRVSQWLSEGKIGPEALIGEGPKARIIVPVAVEQLRERLDVNQRHGLNGLGTDLSDAEVEDWPAFSGSARSHAAPASPRSPEREKIELFGRASTARIAAEKFKQVQMQTERMEEERRERQGLYLRTRDAHAGMERLARRVASTFESALPDLSHALAAEFGMPQRDALHFLRAQFRELRSRAFAAASAEVEGLPQLIAEPEEASQ